jgi:hypothetical protein
MRFARENRAALTADPQRGNGCICDLATLFGLSEVAEAREWRPQRFTLQ